MQNKQKVLLIRRVARRRACYDMLSTTLTCCLQWIMHLLSIFATRQTSVDCFSSIFLATVQRMKYVNRKNAVAVEQREVSWWMRSGKCLYEENVSFSTEHRSRTRKEHFPTFPHKRDFSRSDRVAFCSLQARVCESLDCRLILCLSDCEVLKMFRRFGTKLSCFLFPFTLNENSL